MIEVISTEKCTGCNICVHVCPTQVFVSTKAGVPRVAAQEDCQTCFMCELYCPEDALFVLPLAEQTSSLTELDPVVQQQLGSYRHAIGWGQGQRSTAADDRSFELMNRAH